MLWIVALATVAIAATLVRHAVQDHRDAEVQRRDALADIERHREWLASSSPGAAKGDVELTREVERDVPGVAIPSGAHGPTNPQSDDRAHTR